MTALHSLAKGETARLNELATSQSHLMIRLVHTECLLQLARLQSAELDLATYCELVTQTLEQFLPLVACRMSVAIEDVPPIVTIRGNGEQPCPTAPLTVGAEGRGELALAVDPEDLGPVEFVEAVADQVSHGIRSVSTTERLRRQAAIAEVGRMINGLDDPVTEEDLQQIVTGLSYLPNIVGLQIDIAHPLLDEKLRLSAGLSASQHLMTVDLDGGFCDVAVMWAAQPTDPNREAIADAVGSLVAALHRVQDYRRVAAEAQTDSLTGLGNRRRGEHDLADAILAVAANGSVAVACLDLDFFKQVNDRFGHPTGDQLLIRFAAHLQSCVGIDGTVARMGGEEFMIVWPAFESAAATEVLRRLIHATPEACRLGIAPDWAQTVSVGLATYPQSGLTPGELMAAADRALYLAKAGGRNRLEVAVGCHEAG